MSQESNTTSDTNPKPRLQIARPKDAPPAPEPTSPASAAEASAAVPRFSFARKKAPAPAPAAAPGPPTPPLKHPPPGSRLFTARELSARAGAMPAPLPPVTRGATPAPIPGQAKAQGGPRSHVPLLIMLGVLVIIVGGESTYILMQDEKVAAVIKAAPPVVIGSGASGAKPAEIAANSPADTPAAKYLQAMAVDFEQAGANPQLSIGGQVFKPGQVIDKATGLKWILIDDKARQLEFVDGQGLHYIKKF